MRIGAIFARGSCRALKWTALLGVLFALGAGAASAQITITGPADNTVREGETATYTVSVKGFIPTTASSPATFTVTLGTPSPDTTDVATTGEATDVSQNRGDVFTVQVPAAVTGATTNAPFDAMGYIYVQTTDDTDAEDEKFTLSFTLTSGGGLVDGADPTATPAPASIALPTGDDAPPAGLTIDDVQEQFYHLDLKDGEKPTENQMNDATPPVRIGSALTLRADPVHEDGGVTLTLNLDDPVNYKWDIDNDFTATDNSPIRIGAPEGSGNAAATASSTDVYVLPPANDMNRIPNTVTLTAHSGVAGAATKQAEEPITFADANVLPNVEAKFVAADGSALDEQPMSLMEGETYKIELTVIDEEGDPAPAAENLEIALIGTGSADMDDYDLVTSPVSIAGPVTATSTPGQMSGTVDLVVAANEEVNMEDLGFDAVVTGDPMYGTEPGPTIMGVVAMLPIDDITTKLVFPMSEDEVRAVLNTAKEAAMVGEDMNPGEMFQIDMDELFGRADGFTVELAFDADTTDASVAAVSESGTMLTVTAGTTTDVEAMVTVTAAVTSSSPSMVNIPDQTRANVAQVQFPVTVVNVPLMVDVSTDAMDGAVAEGGMLKVMAESNRAVLEDEDATVMLEVSGPVDMSMMDGDPMITIMAGETMGETMLYVMDDDMVQPMGNIVITATGAGITGAQTLEIMVTEDDMETSYDLTVSVDSVMVDSVMEGESVTITATASQPAVAETMIDLVLGASDADADDYSLEPMMITIPADSDTGMVTLTAAAGDGVEGDETLMLNGHDRGLARRYGDADHRGHRRGAGGSAHGGREVAGGRGRGVRRRHPRRLDGGRSGCHGRHEHAVRHREHHRHLLERVVRHGDGHHQRQRVDGDPHAGGRRLRHHHGDGPPTPRAATAPRPGPWSPSRPSSSIRSR